MNKQVIGRFLLQPNKNFPVDCETFASLQDNIAIVQALGNIVGDKAVLLGCELEQNNTSRKEGYVFLKTKDYPDGEIIYWEGGNVSAGMYVKQEVTAITAEGYEFPVSYITRSLAAGIGTENYQWSDFKQYKTPRQLETDIENLKKEIEKLSSLPFGVVQTWAGAQVPTGYMLCEGQELKISDYPDLYAAINITFNNAYSATGTRYSTTNGYFRLPDLRGRFIVGHNAADFDYNTYGNAAGEKQHTLTVLEIPSHEHPQYLWKEGSGNWKSGGSNSSPNATSLHNQVVRFQNTGATGDGHPHENRPPYYVLAYIMRVK